MKVPVILALSCAMTCSVFAQTQDDQTKPKTQHKASAKSVFPNEIQELKDGGGAAGADQAATAADFDSRFGHSAVAERGKEYSDAGCSADADGLRSGRQRPSGRRERPQGAGR